MSYYPTGNGSEDQANALFVDLVGTENATLPDIDLFDETHTVPWTSESDVFKPVVKLEVAELVSDFQAIMAGAGGELVKEYDSGRITGAKYADVYLSLTQVAMQNAVQFALGKGQAFWMAAKTQAEAIAANNQNEAVRLQAMLSLASYALTKLKLATEDSAFGVSEYQRETMLPAQLKQVQEQMEAARAQTMDTRSDENTTVTGLLGKQKDLYSQQKQSYIDDTKIKATRIFQELWQIQKTMDGATMAPDAFSTDGEVEADNFNKLFLNMRLLAGAPAWDDGT